MGPLALSPYFHPTTIVLVDDNQAFLQSLTLELPASLACRSFTDPDDALEFLNAPPDLPPLVDRCFSLDRSGDAEAVIRLNLGAIEQEIKHLERFQRVSVVLVDYAMPWMDGLDFCQRLTDPYPRRAMLTGVADEKLAVEAFNAGLIHRFIPKHKGAAVEAVSAFIGELEREYFGQSLARLQTALAIDPPGFLVDRRLAGQLRLLMHHQGIVEYYLVTDPPGFLMLRSDGSVIRLVLLDERDLHDQAAYARRHGAPRGIREAVERGELVGVFSGESPDDYFGDEHYPWQEKLVPAQRLTGERHWYAGLLRNAATDVDFDPAESSYDAYLRHRSRG